MAGDMRRFFSKVKKQLRSLRGRRVEPLSVEGNSILLNVFKTHFRKRVLLSYIQQPFIEGIKYHHTNYLECYTAAEVFSELGYCVDVVDLFDNKTVIDFPNYDIVYGMGVALEKSFYSSCAERIVKIYYSTGCNPFYSFKASALSVRDFYFSKGKLIPQSSRVLEYFWPFQYLLSNCIIALGNQFVADTFLELDSKLNCHCVNAFYFNVNDIDIDKKDFGIVKNHFLWFGSSGLLHKGLNLLIDIFERRKDITLHICGADKNETKFWEHYQPVVDNCSNIVNHNFIDIESTEFKELMNNCAFCIFPTASEGGAPSMLNVMANGGLIPIASKACGIDIGNLGFVFETLSQEEIEKHIEKAMMYTSSELIEKSKFVKEFVRSNYTFDIYKSNIKNNISHAIISNKT
ncbi:MAG: glycosyl transferase, group 1 family protein [Segetibacter sp.]|nr:glycosyl transferase, group 1 family protein [Segetibacter sp.]